MRGRLWLKYFIMSLEEKEKKDYPKKPDDDGKWTEFMKSVMEGVGEKMDCYVVQRFSVKGAESGEYLNIDAFFIDNAEYDLVEEEKNGWDPFVLPHAVLELENSNDVKKICYCLWKVLCVRAQIRVLICYQNGGAEVTALRKLLEDVVWQGSLMKGTDGDLLVIIGDESIEEEASWGDYFTAFEWRNDRLEKIDGLKW